MTAQANENAPENTPESNVEQAGDNLSTNTRRRWLFRLILVGGTTLIALLVLEVAVRIMNPPIQVGPALVRFSETLGFELKPNLDCTRRSSEYVTMIQTNSLGMRGPEVVTPKPDGVVRILCIGDSFTFGRGVERDETFIQQLQRRLNEAKPTSSEPRGVAKYELLNAGVVGWGTGNQLIYLQDRGLKLDPDVILLQMYKNDPDDNMRSTLFDLDESGQLKRGPAYQGLKTITALFNAIPGKSLLENSYLFNYARTFLNISVRPGGHGKHELTDAEVNERRRKSHELTTRLLQEFVSTAREKDLPLIVMTIDFTPEQAHTVDSVLEANNVTTLRLNDMKRDHPDLYFNHDFHWNRKGHQWAADRIQEHLTNLLSLKPPPGTSE